MYISSTQNYVRGIQDQKFPMKMKPIIGKQKPTPLSFNLGVSMTVPLCPIPWTGCPILFLFYNERAAADHASHA